MTENKLVLVTGSSRGIGAETVRLFAKNGYSVVINYLHNEHAAKKLKSEILTYGVGCIIVQADVTIENEVHKLFKQTDQLGRLSVLVNNAGILDQQARLTDISAQRFANVLLTNVMSCFLCTKEAVSRMSTCRGGIGGAIINVSSGAAKTGSPNEYIDYAASKGAIDTLTKGAALELASEGIRVNGVRPGLIYTEIHASGGEADRVDRLKDKIPVQRGGQPIDVAEAIYWLATEKSSYVTGTFIDTTGGL